MDPREGDRLLVFSHAAQAYEVDELMMDSPPHFSTLLQRARTSSVLRMSDEAVVDVLSDLEELDSLVTDRSDDADLEPSQAYLNKLAMQASVRQWQRDEKDSGSPEVQVRYDS
jgi:hypothetical protein